MAVQVQPMRKHGDSYRLSQVYLTASTLPTGNRQSAALLLSAMHAGEDMHYMLARRYGIPMISARDALYDIIFDDALALQQLGYTRKDLLLDFIHPTWIGHHLYGRGLVAYGMHNILRRELDALANGGSLEVPPRPMPRPVSPLAAQQVTNGAVSLSSYV